MQNDGRPAEPWRDEGRKLLATALNNLAVATVVAGVTVPAVGLFYGLASAPRPSWSLAAPGLCWLGAAAILHIMAQRILRRLSA